MQPGSVGLAAITISLSFGVAACGDQKAPPGPAIPGTRLTVYSSLPLRGASAPQSQAIADGARLALSDAGARVGKYTIKYVSLDDSVAATGAADDATVAKNARRAVANRTTIAYIGEFNSGATKVSLPILNRSSIAQISPSNTYVGLTTDKPGSRPGEPDEHYPSGERTFARIVPADDVQGAALAAAARSDGCKTLEIWNSGTSYSAGLARNLEIAASKVVSSRPGPAGARVPAPAHLLEVVGNVRIDPKGTGYRALAQRIDADCFVFTGEVDSNAVQVYKEVATADPSMRLFGGDALVSRSIANPRTGLPADVASRWEGTFPTLPPSQLGSAGRKFFDEFERTYDQKPDPYAIYGYEAMALTLDAIKRAENADGEVSRAGVVGALLGTRNRHSAIGTYSIDSEGDTTLESYGLYRISRGGLVFDKIVDTSPR